MSVLGKTEFFEKNSVFLSKPPETIFYADSPVK